MSEETEKDSGVKESESKESNNLGQDEISKLIDEMQSEENSSVTEEQVDKKTDDETKQKPDEVKDTESEGKESSSVNQDDISMLKDGVKTEAKSSEVEEKENTAEQVENDNEDEERVKNQIHEDENRKNTESNNNHVEKKNIEERAKSQENDEKLVEGDEKPGEVDKKSKKEAYENNKREQNDKEDSDGFKGLGSNDEVKVDGDADNQPGTGKNESDNKGKKKDEDKDKKSLKDDDGGQAVKLKEVKKRTKRKSLKLLTTCIFCIVFISGLFGVYAFFKKSGTDKIKTEKPIQPEQIIKAKNTYTEEQTSQKLKVYETQDILLSDIIIAKLEEITKLRNELLIKEGQISDLIKSYQNGISKMEDEILSVKQNNQINSFSGAIKNKRIEFGIMTIQRRQTYIKKINTPHKWLNQGIEELLYLKRKIEIDAQISRVISGIDMDKMIGEIDVVIRSYRTGIEKLEIDMKNVELMPLEMIWERIIEKDKFTAKINNKVDEPTGINQPVLTDKEKINRVIWEEICSGNFKRKNEITTLSTEAAKCLSKWKHADLFLNGINDISPEAAKHLLKWKGNWICLNGVKTLSDETAKYLFQWQGNWISLNGLGEISSGLLRYLPQWQGKQLELMGLKYKKSKNERVGLKSLAKWERSGGKLYIPVQIRKVINKL